MRFLIATLIRCLILLLVVRTFFVEPVVVPSGSLAPTIFGEHADVPCEQCGGLIRWGLDLRPLDFPRITCPACGAEKTDVMGRVPCGGDRLLVDRNAYWLRAPRRWEVAAFKDPEWNGRWLVKRIVGLPGEKIELVDGDVFANGNRVEKSLADYEALAIPLEQSTGGKRATWRGASSASQWERVTQREGVVFRHLPTLSADQFDWLEFHPPAGLAGNRVLGDSLPYNQEPLRRPFSVRDVCVAFRARVLGSGMLAIRFPGPEDAVIWVEPTEGQAKVLVRGVPTAEKPFPRATVDVFPVTAAYCDGRVLARLGETELQWRIAPRELEQVSTNADAPFAPPAIGVAGLGVQITDLQLSRDVYYLPGERPAAGPLPTLAGDEYLMLGDNPTISADSRSWTTPGVSRKSLLGRPFLVHWSAKGVRLGGWGFQVPDFERIRYIPPAASE